MAIPPPILPGWRSWRREPPGRGESTRSTGLAIDRSGAQEELVFNASTIFWSQALSSPPGHMLPWSHWSRPHGPDEQACSRVTHNLLRRRAPSRVFCSSAGESRTMSKPPRICVVGSANVDLTFRAPRLPRPGENPGLPCDSQNDSGHGGQGGRTGALLPRYAPGESVSSLPASAMMRLARSDPCYQ